MVSGLVARMRSSLHSLESSERDIEDDVLLRDGTFEDSKSIFNADAD